MSFIPFNDTKCPKSGLLLIIGWDESGKFHFVDSVLFGRVR